MKNLIKKVISSAKRYNIFDFASLKIALICAGILLGTYFSKFFLSYILIIWIFFIIFSVFVIYRTFRRK
jgi:hypothetical protein